MPTRQTVALIVIAALSVTLGGWGVAIAQADPTCRNDAAPRDRPSPDAPPLLAPGAAYTATWRFTNTGDCSWGEGYALTPIDAAALGDPATPLTAAVAPGDTLTVTLTLIAPVAPGYHQGVWRLTDAAAMPFGPWLPLEIEVAGEAANADAAVGDVALPEVLALSGFGAISVDDAAYYYEDPCLAAGDAAQIVLDPLYLLARERERVLLLCNVTPGRAVTVTLTAPTGELFHRSVIVPEPVPFTAANGDAYTRNLVGFPLGWLPDAASGVWHVVATTADGDLTAQIELAPLSNPPSGMTWVLDTRPIAVADPFAAGEGCHYTYITGEPFFITGAGFPPAAPVQLGVYEQRMGVYYFAERLQVITDAAGSFRKLYAAAEPGREVDIYLLDELDPDALAEDGVSYDPFLAFDAGTTLSSCYSVRPASDIPPLRLAFAMGAPGAAEVGLYDPDTPWTAYISQGLDACDSGAPTWADDGGLVYHSKCGGSYDLYRHSDPGAFDVTAAPIFVTPDADETDPSVAGDGRIVFRRAAAGTDPNAADELWVLDPGASEPVALGVAGHAPAWSPDGTQIAYMSDRMADGDGTWQVYVYNLATATSRLISVDCPGHCRYPAWSPDGTQLVYVAAASADDLTPAGLWLATLADGTVLPWHSGAYGRPDWSASGWVIFAGPDGLYRARPASVPQRYLRNAETPLFDPAWSY